MTRQAVFDKSGAGNHITPQIQRSQPATQLKLRHLWGCLHQALPPYLLQPSTMMSCERVTLEPQHEVRVEALTDCRPALNCTVVVEPRICLHRWNKCQALVALKLSTLSL